MELQFDDSEFFISIKVLYSGIIRSAREREDHQLNISENATALLYIYKGIYWSI